MSKLTKEERELYESDLKAKSDWNGGMDWAKKQAAQQAELAAKLEIAKNMKAKGMTLEDISELTHLPIEEIENL